MGDGTGVSIVAVFRRGSKRFSVRDAPPFWELGFPFFVGLLGLCLCGVGLPLVVWAL